MLLIAGSIAMGILVGLRYRVFVLVPIILVGTFAICAISPEPLPQALVSTLTFALLLQISYVGGALLKFAAGGGVTAVVPGELSRIRPR
ncbi:hypothetical protein JQ580_26555 [Bradyrhizobium japonicum]|jgi:hypothetical protein|uniref:hypothetical protein n=1 Tax=Bradyrhizobium japonicum TaxID=375 RepID=UPI001BAAABA2|nr:hypothetical protein [Bradyrhizobium japonicum]MBR0994288.1 hypothetical protein [Bradyrhizobium japonicum]